MTSVILSREDFLAALGTAEHWRVAKLYFTDNTPDDGSRHVTACIEGDSKGDALAGAESALKVVEGKRVFVRVPPEAESQYDFEKMKWLHYGYVRFSFHETGSQ